MTDDVTDEQLRRQVPPAALALLRPSMRRPLTAADAAWVALKKNAEPSSLQDFLALPTVRRLVSVCHDRDNALLAVVVAVPNDGLIVSAGVHPDLADGARPHGAQVRRAGVRWAPEVSLLSELPPETWLPCPKCNAIALAASTKWLREHVAAARRSKPQRVAVTEGVIAG